MVGEAVSCVCYEEAAALTAQLPRDSRVMRTIDPDGAYTVTDMLLRNIELWTHVAAWQNTKEGKHGRNKPELVKLPSQMPHTRSIEDAIADRKYVDSVLGAAAKRSDESDTSPLKEVD